jgi:hypothetical protein
MERIAEVVRREERRHRNARPPAGGLTAFGEGKPQLVRLVAPLHRGLDSVGAIFQDWNGAAWSDAPGSTPTITVAGDFAFGEALATDRQWVIPQGASGKWYPVGTGRYACVGTLAANLGVGGSATITVSGQVVTVFERYGAVASAKLIGAAWDDAAVKWFVNAYNC